MRSWVILLFVCLGTACKSPEAALRPASSRVAGTFAYLAEKDGYWQVWIVREDGESGRLLTHSPVDKTRLSWAPSGKSLLVNTQTGHLLHVDAISGEEIALDFPMKGMLDAVLSPDGKRIAFSYTTSDSPDANELWVSDLDGSHARPLTRRARLQHSPTWDPNDGAWIYYSSGLGPGKGYDVWRIRPDGSGDQRLSFEGAYRLDTTVARDGTLAYSGNDQGAYDLWLKPVGKPPLALTQDPALDASPSFSPDGSKLLFESTRSGVLNVWMIPTRGGEPVQVTGHGAPGARMPVYAPSRRAAP